MILGIIGLIFEVKMVLYYGLKGLGRDSVLECCGPTKLMSQGGSASGERRGAIGQGHGSNGRQRGFSLCFGGRPRRQFLGPRLKREILAKWRF